MSTETAQLDFAYDKTGYELGLLDFAYDKNATAYKTASLDFSYWKVSGDLLQWDPTATPVSYMTQIIGNTFPYWHAARRVEGGRTQRVINSLGAFHLEQLFYGIRKHRANLHLSQADVSEPDQVWALDRPVAKPDHKRPINLLLNPAFSYIHPQRLGPWAWSRGFFGATGDFEMRRGRGLYGQNAVRLTADVGEAIALEQGNNLVFREGDQITVTVWYAGMRPDRGNEDIYLHDGPRLLLSVEYADDTVEMHQAYLRDDTGGGWLCETFTVTASKETHEIGVSVVVEPREGEKCVIEVGAVQLEYGAESTPFTEHVSKFGALFLVSPFETVVESTDWGSITYTRQSVTPIEDNISYDDLVDRIPPSRASITPAVDEQGVTYTTLGVRVDDSGRQFTTGWRINGSNLIERYNAMNRQSEVFNTFKVADLFGNGGTEVLYFKPDYLGVTSVFEALTVAGEWLYVIVKETWNGKTMRLLKVCRPIFRWNEIGYLESVSDVYLDDGTGTCESVGLIESRTDRLLLVISGVPKVAQLIWDAGASNGKGMVVLRSDPGEAILVD